ncbi:MAG TPA: hypothetical protein VFS43_07770 [Polyangiaceae bacterium]|nr:hypothetical protein [Polyangiaceae bacterium]
MGTLQRSVLGLPFFLTPLLLGACGAVTPDDGGLFGSVAASAPDGGAGATGQGGGGGGGPTPGGGGGPAAPTKITAADKCENAFAVTLGYGPGLNKFVGSGDTTGDSTPVEEGVCENDAGVPTTGPDRVHAITVNAPEGGYLTARLVRSRTDFDAVLYLRTFCAGGAGTICEDAFTSRGDAREAANGGDVLSVFIPPVASDTFFLYVDGAGADQAGRYELEVSLSRGNCEDPIPLFIEPGSPVRARVNNRVAANVMTHSCSNTVGTADLMFQVTRASPGPMRVTLNSSDGDLGLAFMDRTCNGKGGEQVERPSKCSRGPGASLDDAWPDPNRSIFVAIDAGVPVLDGVVFDIIFDPSGGLEP